MVRERVPRLDREHEEIPWTQLVELRGGWSDVLRTFEGQPAGAVQSPRDGAEEQTRWPEVSHGFHDSGEARERWAIVHRTPCRTGRACIPALASRSRVVCDRRTARAGAWPSDRARPHRCSARAGSTFRSEGASGGSSQRPARHSPSSTRSRVCARAAGAVRKFGARFFLARAPLSASELRTVRRPAQRELRFGSPQPACVKRALRCGGRAHRRRRGNGPFRARRCCLPNVTPCVAARVGVNSVRCGFEMARQECAAFSIWCGGMRRLAESECLPSTPEKRIVLRSQFERSARHPV